MQTTTRSNLDPVAFLPAHLRALVSDALTEALSTDLSGDDLSVAVQDGMDSNLVDLNSTIVYPAEVAGWLMAPHVTAEEALDMDPALFWDLVPALVPLHLIPYEDDDYSLEHAYTNLVCHYAAMYALGLTPAQYSATRPHAYLPNTDVSELTTVTVAYLQSPCLYTFTALIGTCPDLSTLSFCVDCSYAAIDIAQCPHCDETMTPVIPTTY